jgi:hypothetical protein
MLNRIRVSFLAGTLGAALLSAIAVPQLRASEIDKKTVVTFSAPVELSGRTLPAGTYVFKTLDEDRNVVIVMNSAENHVFATVHSIPTEVLAAPDKPQIHFSESPSNAPEAEHSWFYPGDNTGWEFLNPNTEK